MRQGEKSRIPSNKVQRDANNDVDVDEDKYVEKVIHSIKCE